MKEKKQEAIDVYKIKYHALKLIRTEESSDLESIWSRSSLESEHRIHSYVLSHKYRDADQQTSS